MGPAEKVHNPVEAGQLAARLLLTLRQAGRLGSEQVVDGSDHGQTYSTQGQQANTSIKKPTAE